MEQGFIYLKSFAVLSERFAVMWKLKLMNTRTHAVPVL